MALPYITSPAKPFQPYPYERASSMEREINSQSAKRLFSIVGFSTANVYPSSWTLNSLWKIGKSHTSTGNALLGGSEPNTPAVESWIHILDRGQLSF